MLFFNAVSIKKKVIWSMAFAVLASTMIVGGIAQYQSRDVLEHRLVDIELPSFLDGIRHQIDRDVSELLLAAEQLANNEFVKATIDTTDIDPKSEKVLIQQLNNLKQQYHLNDASVANRKTAYYWNQNGFLRQLNHQQDQWFYQFVASGKPTMVSMFQEPNGDVKMFANYQSAESGTLSGMSKSMDDMVRLLNGFRIEDSGFVFLTDAQGNVKIHPDKAQAAKKLSALYGAEASVLLGKDGFHLIETQYQGEAVFVASEYIPSMHWYVIASVPKREVYAEMNQAAQNMMLSTVVIAALFIFMSVLLANSITKPIRQIAARFTALGKGDGDLSQRIEIVGNDEITQLSVGFNDFIAKIHQSMQEVASTSRTLSHESQVVAEKAHLTHDNSQSQRDQTIQVVTAMNEMGATISEIASNAAVAASTANDASVSSDAGQVVVNQAKDAIHRLAEDMQKSTQVVEKLAATTQEIGSILAVIHEISDQTNLLALNAAIEAARAGEQGRGFAVVAEEVRNLAGRTAASTEQIQVMMTQLKNDSSNAVQAMNAGQERTQEGVAAAESTVEQLRQISERIYEITDRNTQVATATEEQSVAVQSINENIEEINAINELTTTASEELAEASRELKNLSERLDHLVGGFRL
ncbi:Methyl-accepting chemotaxis protein PctB [Vibrio ruber DSM 16370]|uniref:Methyl-accepting chemotaxis protein PctB n=1 Tax=Vibrio ruber (strain DSM 16370 / JCM 11486 / BCRC 17186 / CECT 7878 / LMG 23124 / VR1) TaxID=1123498 RepID=A0A1R4LR70_VIBR1|nr:methyl-accepting chemotaxis protein [Vibrio ruber]SJN59015.1 Methyl-accepting chemotaxis protein PctB [Vibrio ruber DSM 16370]